MKADVLRFLNVGYEGGDVFFVGLTATRAAWCAGAQLAGFLFGVAAAAARTGGALACFVTLR